MHKSIQVRNERARGCGYRKPGGLYLFSDGGGRACGMLPIVLTTCPTCGQSMCPDAGKQNRGFSWVEDFSKLVQAEFCSHPEAPAICATCPLGAAIKIKRCGIIWVGKEFYPTPEDFTKEANEMGISRRIPMLGSTTIKTSTGVRKVPAIPRGFKVGETWIALAHPAVAKNPEPQPQVPAGLTGDLLREAEAERDGWSESLPGIFHMYRPQRIEYVVRPEECNDAEFVQYLIDRGITPVHVVKIGETDDMFDAAEIEKEAEATPVSRRRGRNTVSTKPKRKGKKPEGGSK
jgi:hypothetical protein